MNARALLETTANPAFGVDGQGTIVAWNDGAEEALGYRRFEALGRNCWQLLAGRDGFGNPYCDERCPIRALARRGQPVHPTRLIYRNAAGEAQPSRVILLVLNGKNDGPLEVVHVLYPDSAPVAGDAAGASGRRRGESGWRLTRRQREILALIAEGRGTREIGSTLGLSEATVRHHVQELLRRLRVHNRLAAVSVANRLGLIDPRN